MFSMIYQLQIEGPAAFSPISGEPENYFSRVIQSHMAYIFCWILSAHVGHRIFGDPQYDSITVAQSRRQECNGHEKPCARGQSRYRI